MLVKPVIYNVTMTSANTEYSLDLPNGAKLIEIRCRTSFDIRYAFETGKVAASTNPYRTLTSGSTKTIENLYLNSETMYFACSDAGKVMEIEVWT